MTRIGGADTTWEAPEHVLLWVPDYRVALHLMMAMDGSLADDRPLVQIETARCGEVEDFMAASYPTLPYRWVFNAVAVFSSAVTAGAFEAAYQASITCELEDPITGRAFRCIERTDQS